MEQLFMTLRIVVPIFTIVGLGIFAKKRKMMTTEQISGLQQFVVQFGIPCVLFNSCFTATINGESIASMILVIPLILLSSLWAFIFGRKLFPYHNFPMLFSAQETGMLGIPLYMTLFGTAQAFRIGMLDLAQAVIAIPVIAIMAAKTTENLSIKEIAMQVFRSPLLIMSLLGLILNLSGAASMLDSIGLKSVILETVNFISQPVSATMLFCVGYNFSISKENQKTITKIALIHFTVFSFFGLIMQGILSFIGDVDLLTRYAVFLYSILPASYLSPSFGKNEEEYVISSGVCSLLTIATLIIFCVLTVIAA